MQSHEDRSHSNEFMKRLMERAEKCVKEKSSQIAGGREGEGVLDEWGANTFHVKQLPDDEQGILRISIGGGSEVVPLDYCVFRGDRLACLNLLRKAVKALETRKP